jgi:hypothetical protein
MFTQIRNRFARPAAASVASACTSGDVCSPDKSSLPEFSTEPQGPEQTEEGERRFTLKEARAAVIDYFSDIAAHVDFSNLRDYGDGEFIVKARHFKTVSGMRLLGSGAYSDVYAISPTKVLKIVKTKDKGYARFVALCGEHKDNPYLPKIFYSGRWEGKTVYVLERLSEKVPQGDSHHLKRMFRNAVTDYRDTNNPYITFCDPHLAAISHLLRENSMTNDLHNGNIMFRGNQPVITDPCT